MFFIAAFFVLGTLTSVRSVEHSLTYIYTAFSHPVKLPGIHEFTAMGLLDNRMIDYYDSSVQKKIPKQKWMKERLQPEYWEKGTQSRQSKQQWFKVNIDILINRMRQTSNDTHVLQWMHGCVGKEDDNGNIQFERGMDMYNYDGDDFLRFDDEHQVWVAAADAAFPTKRKWDDVTALKDYTKGYLEKECMEWMKTFLKYSTEQEKVLSTTKPPEVFMFATPAKKKSNMVLTCFATGFLPKEITMEIKRDLEGKSRVLSADDGLVSSGVRPNEDDTFQRRDHVEILKTDPASYSCRVIHKATNMDVEQAWDHQHPDNDATGIIIGAAAGVVVLIAVGIVAVVIVMLKKKRKPSPSSSTSSMSSPENTELLKKNSNESLSSGDSAIGSIKSQDSNEPLMNSTEDAKGKPSPSSSTSSMSHVGLTMPPENSEIPNGISQTSNDSSEEIRVPLMGSNESLNSGDSAFGSPKDSRSTSPSSLSSA
ncbi:H-2 class I histocompatibility antigen, L-D alpha chain isoform X1 [Oryzias latipes]|uniref:Ig-like domain-containing protein n=1 Tax=Oryzias latipes TaxID=8090 RepID=H2L676_ORYLA|nr:H-2 class I histocompatibility antigen, L-D alpha chain isoform X1 [Oryzias latipes]